jgi:hypothetical protein
MPAILGWFALGLLIGAVLILAWSGAGFFVAITHYLIHKPPPAAPPVAVQAPDCSVCNDLHGLWNDMSFWEKVAALPNFVAASIICAAKGCGGIPLPF